MAKTIKVLHPSYYTGFRCIGGECGDLCCKRDWRIIIDKDTYWRYQGITDPVFSQQIPGLLKRIESDKSNDFHYAELVLDEHNTCKFLQKDGLCGIQVKYGYDYLSRSCQLYPRASTILSDDILEVSLYLTCPETISALFTPKPITFQVSEFEESDTYLALKRLAFRVSGSKKGGRLADFAFLIRQGCIDILQSRNIPLADRIFVVGTMLSSLTRHSASAPGTDEINAKISAHIQIAKDGGLRLESNAEDEGMRAVMEAAMIKLVLRRAAGGGQGGNLFSGLVKAALAWASTQHPKGAGAFKMEDFVKTRTARYWQSFLTRREYVLENYFVSFVFCRAFPFSEQDELDPYHHFIILAEQYAMMRILLCAHATEEEGITDKALEKTLAALAQKSQHSQESRVILEVFKETGLDSRAHISALLSH